MGGFAGGDEAGYWDESPSGSSHASRTPSHKPSIQHTSQGFRIHAYAKIEHPESNRWIRSDELYDVIEFIPCPCDTFTLEGSTPSESNLIYRAYLMLRDTTNDPEIVDFFSHHKVVVTKNIPMEERYGGDVSDAAAFLHMAKEVCNLILSTDELAKLGAALSPHIPFFIYNVPEATITDPSKVLEYFQA